MDCLSGSIWCVGRASPVRSNSTIFVLQCETLTIKARMSPKKSKKQRSLKLQNLFSVAYCVVCENVIMGADGTFSLIKIFDQINAVQLPALAKHMLVVAELRRNEASPPSVLKQA